MLLDSVSPNSYAMFKYTEPETENPGSEKKLITNFVFLMISESQDVLNSGLFVFHSTAGAPAKMMVDVSRIN